jgi:hypothetical protein
VVGDPFRIGDTNTADDVTTEDRRWITWRRDTMRWELLGGGIGTTTSGGGGVTVLIDWQVGAATHYEPLVCDDWDQSSRELTMPAGHKLLAGDLVDLYWAAATGWRNSRLGVTVSTVGVTDTVDLTDVVLANDGTGDAFPVDATLIQVGPYRLRPNELIGLKTLSRSGSSLITTRGTDATGTVDSGGASTSGVLAMDSGHGLLKLEEIFVFWSTTGFTRGRILTIDGDDITIITDTNLPADATAVTVTHYEAVSTTNDWPESINPGTDKKFVVKLRIETDGTLTIDSWTCVPSSAFEGPPLPPLA